MRLTPLSTSAVLTSASLTFDAKAFAEMIGHAYDGYPLEACGLLVGTSARGAGRAKSARVQRFVACTNEAQSAKVYTIPPIELLRAERYAEADGLAVIGVFHSHTHTEPYPSPTDIAQAPDPDWAYVIVSLKRDAPETRAYRIVGEAVADLPVAIVV